MSDLTPAWFNNQYERLESLLRMKQLFIEKKIKNWAKSNELSYFANTDKSIYHFYLNDGSLNTDLEPKNMNWLCELFECYVYDGYDFENRFYKIHNDVLLFYHQETNNRFNPKSEYAKATVDEIKQLEALINVADMSSFRMGGWVERVYEPMDKMEPINTILQNMGIQVNNPNYPDRFYNFDFINDSMSMIKSCYKLYLMKLCESFDIPSDGVVVVDKNYNFNALDKTINDFYKTVITPEW